MAVLVALRHIQSFHSSRMTAYTSCASAVRKIIIYKKHQIIIAVTNKLYHQTVKVMHIQKKDAPCERILILI